MLSEQLARLAACGIDLLPVTGIESHYVFHRDGFMALVERKGEGFGSIGSPGLFVETGFAALVSRGGNFYFVGKGFERQAREEEVVRLRSFASDLKNALAG